MIVYDGIYEQMKKAGLKEYKLRDLGISPSIFTKLRKGSGGLDHRTINKLCNLLCCQPGDLMEYIPDKE